MSSKKLQNSQDFAKLANEKDSKTQIADESEGFRQRLTTAFGGKSLAEIAKILGVNYSSLWNWANQRSQIPIDVLFKISELTGVSLEWLIFGDKAMISGKPSKDDIYSLVKRAVREELVKMKLYPTSDFDLEEAIDQGLPPGEILNRWFASEGIEDLDIGLLFFYGWSGLTREKQIEALQDAKKILDKKIKDRNR